MLLYYKFFLCFLLFTLTNIIVVVVVVVVVISADCVQKNWHFSTDRSLYFANGTRYGHSYNERPLTADSFAVSCIGLGRVNIFRFAMGWVGFDGSTAISA